MSPGPIAVRVLGSHSLHGSSKSRQNIKTPPIQVYCLRNTQHEYTRRICHVMTIKMYNS